METVHGVYFPYHKSEFFSPADEGYDAMPRYPKEFRRYCLYKTSAAALNAYANTICPASQLFECKEDEVDKVIADFDAKFADPEWLKVNIDPYI